MAICSLLLIHARNIASLRQSELQFMH